MKSLKTIFSLLIVAAISLSITACNGGGTSSVDYTSNFGSSLTGGGDVNSKVGIDELENKTITYLADYDPLANPSVGAQLFYEKFGGKIEAVRVTRDEMYDKMAELIIAEQSPDIFDYHWNAFPHGISRNQYEALDDYIDLTDPIWQDVAPIAEQYAWKGEHYYYPINYYVNYALIYDVDLIQNEGLEDPYELYQNGNWTWDTMYELMTEFCSNGEDRYGYFGLQPASFIATTGETMVSVEPDGTIVNNLRSPEVTRAMEYIEKCNKEGLFGDRSNVWRGDTALNDGDILFYGMGIDWMVEALSKARPDANIFFVPFPRDPNATAYFHNYESVGKMVIKGSKNIEGAVAFITCERMTQVDEKLQEEAKKRALYPEQKVNANGDPAYTFAWTEEQWDFKESWNVPGMFDLVFDHIYGFNAEADTLANDMLNGMLLEGTTWTTSREETYPALQAILDEYATN